MTIVAPPRTALTWISLESMISEYSDREEPKPVACVLTMSELIEAPVLDQKLPLPLALCGRGFPANRNNREKVTI